MRKYLYIFLVSALSLSSCSQSVKQYPFFDTAGLASTCVANSDSAILILRDYYPQINDIKIIKSSDHEIIPLSSGGKFDTVMVVSPESAPVLSTLELVTDKGEKGVIVYEKKSGEVLESELPFISSIRTNYSGNKIEFKTNNAPATYLVLWQNTILDGKFISYKEKGNFSITVPDNACALERSFIRVFVSNKNGIGNDVLIPLEYGKVINNPSDLDRTDRQTQILYSLMIDRFYDGNPSNNWQFGDRSQVLEKVDYWGGDIAGVTAKIKDGYFDSLGVNTLWLSPITQNPYDLWGFNKDPRTKFSGYHGYWPIYLTKIDKRFGTEEELRTLLSEAHKKGDNVILDYVANHVHINSPTLKEHKDWTTPFYTPDGRENLELWDEFRLTTWFDKHIPSLDLGKDYINEPLTDSALFWMKNYEFDGFRHDATKHIPEVYWRKLTKKLLDSIPSRSLYQIGETYGSPSLISSYIKSGMLDAQFDFNIYDRFIDATLRPDGSFDNFSKTIDESLQTYGYHNLMGNITGNHDRARYVSYAGGDVSLDEDTKAAGWKRDIGVGNPLGYKKLSLLHALIFTLPGNPCIYYGDEWGQPGANDPDNRRWAQFEAHNDYEQNVYNEVKQFAHLRRNSMPLMYGDYYKLFSSKDVLSYIRVYMGNYVILTLNKSDKKENISFKLPLGLTYNGNNEISVEINPYEYSVIINNK